jgi:F-type H+-transporting ATPase subunit b
MATEAATAEAGHAAAEAGQSAGHAVGMPQLDLASFPNQIFWLVLALSAIGMIVAKVGLPRSAGILEARSGTISGHVAEAVEL